MRVFKIREVVGMGMGLIYFVYGSDTKFIEESQMILSILVLELVEFFKVKKRLQLWDQEVQLEKRVSRMEVYLCNGILYFSLNEYMRVIGVRMYVSENDLVERREGG